MDAQKYLHVAVGIIKDKSAKVLISLRHNNVHQGGLWEFPGGKLETDETVEQALVRELKEELGISVKKMMPLIQIKHHYSDLKVLLDVWTVTEFSGTAKGCEGQNIAWVSQHDLSKYAFPAANIPIITAVKLPSKYAILNAATEAILLHNLKQMLESGIKLIQARIKSLTAVQVESFINIALPLCRQYDAQLLLNSAVQNSDKFKVDGIHLTSKDLLALKQKPTAYSWVAASCHNQQEILQAEKIGVDFIVIAPVLATQTHPETEPLGWDAFKVLVSQVNIPVFALGGMQEKYRYKARIAGAQGIAGITCFLQA